MNTIQKELTAFDGNGICSQILKQLFKLYKYLINIPGRFYKDFICN